MSHSVPWLAALGLLRVAQATPPEAPESRPIAVLAGALPADETRVRAALAKAGLEDVALIAPDAFAAAIDVVSVTAPPEDCAGAVEMEAWRVRFGAARDRFQLLEFQTSLKDLVALEVELGCLTSPLAASDLLRLQLAMAEAHSFLGKAAGKDKAKGAFHAGQAEAALERAAVFGASLAAPAEVSPEVLAAYDAVRTRSAEAQDPRVMVAGPGARVGARFNGRPLTDGAFETVAGTNFVQASSGLAVTAAAVVHLAPRSRTLLWLSPGGTPRTRGDVVRQIVAFSRGADSPEGRALLAAAARLLGERGLVVFVVEGADRVELWRAAGDTLAPFGIQAPRRAPVDEWRGVLGIAAGGGWSNPDGGDLAGLGGPNVGFGLYGRVRVNPLLSLAATVHPNLVAESLTVEQGGGTLFRATIPMRLGIRFGKARRAIAPEAGVDAGMHYFGTFDEVRASFLLVGAVGVSGAVSPGAALRLEVFGGMGLGYGVAGALAGLEVRL